MPSDDWDTIRFVIDCFARKNYVSFLLMIHQTVNILEQTSGGSTVSFPYFSCKEPMLNSLEAFIFTYCIQTITDRLFEATRIYVSDANLIL